MTQPLPPHRIFPTSKVDARAAEHVPSIPQTENAAYKLAFQDTEFLLREDLRPVRFQLELLKAELLLNEANIGSTFVFYGSARIPAPDMADALVAAATNPEQQAIAERLKAKSRYYEVAHELAVIRPELPVVISSGYITDELRAEALNAGVRGLLEKQNTFEELGKLVAQILARRR